MGLSQSKELIRILIAACTEADRDGESRADNVLSNQDFMKNLATIWKALPANSRTRISGSRSRNAVGKAVSRSVSEITVPELITTDFQQWKENYMTFSRDSEEKEVDFSFCPLAKSYMFLCEAESRGIVCKIQQRILCVLFSRLKDRFGRSRLHSDVLPKFTSIILRSGLVAGDEVSVGKRLGDWACFGKRYDLLASDLGALGSLILLPDDIRDSLWRKELRMKGQDRKQVIKALKDRNLNKHAETSGANRVADNILGYLWNLIEQSISKDLEVDLAGPSGGIVSLLQTPTQLERASYSASDNASGFVEKFGTERGYQPMRGQVTSGDRGLTELENQPLHRNPFETPSSTATSQTTPHEENEDEADWSTRHTRKRPRSGTSDPSDRDERHAPGRPSENSAFLDATQSTLSDVEIQRSREEPSAPARSTERLDGARSLSSLPPDASSLHDAAVDSTCTSGHTAGVLEREVDPHRPSASCVFARNLNESDSQVAETLSGIRSRSGIINTDRGSYPPGRSGNAPQLPTSALNMQPGNQHPINGENKTPTHN